MKNFSFVVIEKDKKQEKKEKKERGRTCRTTVVDGVQVILYDSDR